MFKLVQNKHQQNKLSMITLCSLSLSVQTTLTQIIMIPNTYNRVSSPTQYDTRAAATSMVDGLDNSLSTPSNQA